MRLRLCAGLSALLTLLPLAAAGQDGRPSPLRVASTDGQTYVDVYSAISPDEARRLEDSLGLAPIPHAGAPFVSLDVGEAPEADFLQAVTFTPSHDRVLTANARSHNLAVVDAATGETLAVVPVGARPAAVAATDDVAVVACFDSFEVYLVDLDTYAVRAVVPGVPYPAGVRILPGGTRALVASILGGGARILDLATGAVAVSIPAFPYDGLELHITSPALRLYYRYQPLVTSVTGDTLFATTRPPSRSVMLFDAATGALLRTIPTAVTPRALALSPDGRTLVVGEFLSDRAFQAIDVTAGTAGPVRPLPQNFVSIVSDFAINADGTAVLLGLRRSNGTDPTAALLPVDGGTPLFIPTRSFEYASEASPDGRLALGVGVDGAGVYDFATGALRVLTPGRWYVAAGFSTTGARWGGVPINHPGEVVSLFDATAEPAFLGDVLPGGPLEGDAPAAVGVSRDGTEALVANVYTSAVTRVDLASKAVTAVVPLANVNPGRISALWDDLALVAGTDSTGFEVTTALFDLATGAEVGRLPGLYLRRFARGVEPTVFGWSDAHALVRLRATADALDVVETSEDSLIAGWDVSRDGRLLAVADSTDDRVRFYSGDGGALLGAFGVPDLALVAVAPDGQRVFAASATDALIRRYTFDGTTVAENGTIDCSCGAPELLATNGALVAALASPTVYRFDAVTGEPAGAVPIPYGSVSQLYLTDAGEVVALTEDPDVVFLGSYAYGLANRPTDFTVASEYGLALAVDKGNDALVIGDARLVGVEAGPEAAALALRVSPNPARHAVRVDYTWAGSPAVARLAVYDLLGRLVYRAETPPHGPGRHALTVDPAVVASLPSGIYVVRLQVGDQEARARVTVIR